MAQEQDVKDVKQETLSEQETTRRSFLKRSAAVAVWTPPAVALIMSGASLPKLAQAQYGGNGTTGGGGGDTTGGGGGDTAGGDTAGGGGGDTTGGDTTDGGVFEPGVGSPGGAGSPGSPREPTI